jgi:thiamine transport system ATP-binding protein
VLVGPAASRLLAAGGGSTGPTPGGDAVALRRSALRVAAGGPLRGRVLTSRPTPGAVRLTVVVDGVGEVHAVAEPGTVPPAVGQEVHLVADLSRTARLREDGAGGRTS